MKRIYIILICLLVLLGLSLGGLYWHHSTTYIKIQSETLRRDITELTVTGDQLPDTALLQQLTLLTSLDVREVPLSISQYEQLKKDLPNCRILWKVPFQGAYLAADTTELTITTLTAADLESIPYLPALKAVNAEGCRDYEVLMQLKAQYPALSVPYTVAIGGTEYDYEISELVLANADIEELSAVLPYLPKLTRVEFTETAPDSEAIYQLVCTYPEVEFFWELTVFGIQTSNTAEELDLSGITMADTTELESYLKFFPHMKRVDMCGCGIPSAEMDALSQRWPQIRFIWLINLGFGQVRTDTTAIMPVHLGHTQSAPLNDENTRELKYCIDLVCLDLGHMSVNDLSFLNYMPKLKYLILADNTSQDYSALANLKELIYLEIFMVKNFPNQEVLLNLTNLQDLNMCFTRIENVEIFKQMTWLKRFWASGCGITTPQLNQLQEALPNTVIKTNLPHSTAGNWRDNQNYRDMRDLLGMGYME